MYSPSPLASAYRNLSCEISNSCALTIVWLVWVTLHRENKTLKNVHRFLKLFFERLLEEESRGEPWSRQGWASAWSSCQCRCGRLGTWWQRDGQERLQSWWTQRHRNQGFWMFWNVKISKDNLTPPQKDHEPADDIPSSPGHGGCPHNLQGHLQ